MNIYLDTCFSGVANATGRQAEGVNFGRTYLCVVQDLGLGGVRFEAQHSLSLVKLILNSPRIHLFMAPCGGREREHQWEPDTRVNPFLSDRCPTAEAASLPPGTHAATHARVVRQRFVETFESRKTRSWHSARKSSNFSFTLTATCRIFPKCGQSRVNRVRWTACESTHLVQWTVRALPGRLTAFPGINYTEWATRLTEQVYSKQFKWFSRVQSLIAQKLMESFVLLCNVLREKTLCSWHDGTLVV